MKHVYSFCILIILITGSSAFGQTTTSDNVATQNCIGVSGVIYNNTKIVPDNDPPGFTQYNAQLTVAIRKKDGISKDSKKRQNFIFFRNIYVPLSFNSSSISNLPTHPFGNNNYANYLDMVQYAYLKLPVEPNIVTLIIHNEEKDFAHIYLDALVGFLLTKDTIKNVNSQTEPSYLYGGNLAIKTEKDFSSLVTLEANCSLFCISPISNTFLPDLGIQYSKLSDTSLSANSSKKLYINCPQAIMNLNFTVQFNPPAGGTTNSGGSNTSGGSSAQGGTPSSGSSSKTSSNSTVFARLNLFLNPFSQGKYFNSYVQVEIGYSLDIYSALSGLLDKNQSQSNSNTTSKQPAIM